MHGNSDIKRYFNHTDFFRTKNVSILFLALAIILEVFLFKTVVNSISNKSNPIRKEVYENLLAEIYSRVFLSIPSRKFATLFLQKKNTNFTFETNAWSFPVCTKSKT